jgi:tRNA pseudouridine38-40 synthase
MGIESERSFTSFRITILSFLAIHSEFIHQFKYIYSFSFDNFAKNQGIELTLALLIEYDGTNYGGWQRQPNALTIQECLEKAALGIFGFKVSIVGAGRTDAGVHARGQVAHGRLTAPLKIAEEKIVKAMNAHLPNDIRVNGAKLLRQEFHARFDATAREYSYSIIS